MLLRTDSLRRAFTKVVAATFLANSGSSGVFAAGQFEAASPLNDEVKSAAETSFVHKYLKSGQYMSVSEIKPGMEGYGLTVFQGTKIERFNVKVIGTIKKVLNNRDAILVRLSGPQIGKNNVIRGMSGSPIYIGGKLIGAVSYGFDFSLEPLVGVTPIEYMLDALTQNKDANSPPDHISKFEAPVVPSFSYGGDQRILPASGGAPHMVPLMSPVALAGFSSRAETFLSDRFKDVGLYCSSGGAGGMDASLAPASVPGKDAIAPGGAVCVMLTTGDFNTSACGTATATFNGKFVAFGHPFLQAGFVDFPVASAYIHQVMPNAAASFKMSSPTKIVGAMISDRPWSIGCMLGKSAHMIPVTYKVTDETRHVQRTYRCQIVDHPDLTPELIAATAMSAIDTTHQSSAPYILKMKSELDTNDGTKIERTDRYASNFSVHSGNEGLHFRSNLDPVAAYLYGTATKIMNNDFKRASVKSVALTISLEDGHKAAKIERIYVDNPIVEPGETVMVNCVIHPYDKEKVVQKIALVVPRDVPDGNLLLAVASGDEIESVRKRLGLTDPVPENLNQVIDKIKDKGRGDALYALLALPAQSVTVDGVKLVNPPAHWSKLFVSDRYTHGPAISKGEVKVSSVQDYLLDGSHLMTIEVKRADKASARSQPYSVTATTASPYETLTMTELARRNIGSFHSDVIGGSTSTNSGSGNISANISAATPIITTADQSPASGTSGSSSPFWTATKEYPHSRSVQVWKQDKEESFHAGKTDGVALDSWGRLMPGYKETAQYQLGNDMRIWSAVWSNGSFWFSTSNKVYKWNGQGAPQLVAQLDGVAIPNLVADSKGTLYASVIPGANIYRLKPVGASELEGPEKVNKSAGTTASAGESVNAEGTTVKLLAKTSEPLVTSMTIDKQDNRLYFGVSGSGKVYMLDLKGREEKPSLLFDSGQAAVTSLFYATNEKKLYAGTAEKGAVYSIDDDGKLRAEYQSADHIVTGIARDKENNLYVATAGKGHLVRVEPNGTAKTVESSEAFYSLFYNAQTDQVLAGDGEGDITALATDPLTKREYYLPISQTHQEAVLALATDDQGRYFAGTSNLAQARILEVQSAQPATYTSEVHDATKSAKWSRLRAFNYHYQSIDSINDAIAVESRTGASSQPDASWSNWTAAGNKDGAFVLQAPAGRYMQYRLLWKQDKNQLATAVGKVEVTFLPANSAPEFSNVSLKTGTTISGKESITLTGTDPDGDNLVLALETSSDGGKSWQSLAKDLRPKDREKVAVITTVGKAQKTSTRGGTGQPSKAKRSAIDDSPADDIMHADDSIQAPDPAADLKPESSRSDGWIDLDDKSPSTQKEKAPESKEAKKEGSESGKSEVTKSESEKSKTAKTSTKTVSNSSSKSSSATKGSEASSIEQFTYTWDTSKLKDGSYMLRLTLNDRLSNAIGSEESVNVRSVVVENSPPEILTATWSAASGKEKVGHLRVQAKDKQTAIVNATFKLDDGEPSSLMAVDGIEDGEDETLAADDIQFEHKPHKIVIEVTNKAGLSATKTISVH